MNNLSMLLHKIVLNPNSHARFLNTLSYLENSGAKKIAKSEHQTKVREEILKHASEEFRHAHYLKKQIIKVCQNLFPDYSISNLLGGYATLHYLEYLDLQISRHLSKYKLSSCMFKEAAYLLVTYAIERRAEIFYPLYHEILRKFNSKVTVKSILLEEKEHLEEMERGLKIIDPQQIHAKAALIFENALFLKWTEAICLDLMQRS